MRNADRPWLVGPFLIQRHCREKEREREMRTERVNDNAQLTSYTNVSQFKGRQSGLAGPTRTRHRERVGERGEGFILLRRITGENKWPGLLAKRRALF